MISVLNRGHFLSRPLRSFFVEVVYHAANFRRDRFKCGARTEVKPILEVIMPELGRCIVDTVSFTKHVWSDTASVEYLVLEVG